MANYDNIRLEKGLYCTGSFTSALESIDPSENYKGSSLEGLDAYQRQLKRFDIKVSGAGSDTVEKFFKTTDSATLFPEYVARAVRQGIEEANHLPQIIASVTNIDSLDYRSITSIPTDEEKALVAVAEGEAIPETTVRTRDNLVKLHKRGRMLVASYEAIRFQRLDLFTVTPDRLVHTSQNHSLPMRLTLLSTVTVTTMLQHLRLQSAQALLHMQILSTSGKTLIRMR